MIVIHNYADGSFSPVHYPRKSLSGYLGQQVRSIFDLESIESVKIEFDMIFEFELPKTVRINRFIKNKLKCYFGKTYSVITMPSVQLQIAETVDASENLEAGDIMWKDIIVLPIKLERALLRYMDKFKGFKS
jgi:hypothetical protein